MMKNGVRWKIIYFYCNQFQFSGGRSDACKINQVEYIRRNEYRFWIRKMKFLNLETKFRFFWTAIFANLEVPILTEIMYFYYFSLDSTKHRTVWLDQSLDMAQHTLFCTLWLHKTLEQVGSIFITHSQGANSCTLF